MSLNKVQLIGFLAKDPEVRVAQDKKVASFTLATSERYKDRNGEVKENTEWHNVVCWRQAEYVEKFIAKGAQVYVEGKLRTRSWDDSNGVKRYVTEILADQIQSLDRKRDGQTAQPAQHQSTTPVPAAATAVDDMPDDDLPF